jgi:hypothetical protein
VDLEGHPGSAPKPRKTRKAPKVPSWRPAGASCVGSAHERIALECQDAFSWAFTAAGVLVAVVSDGAGSARFGAEGAQLISRRVVERIQGLARLPRSDAKEHAWRSLFREQLGAVRDELVANAKERNCSPQDLAATCLVLVARGGKVCAAQIGDGAIVVRHETNGVALLIGPQQGEFANETVFLTSHRPFRSLQVSLACDISGFAMLTDGLQSLALSMGNDRSAYPGFFLPLFALLDSAGPSVLNADLPQFLRSDRVRAKTDDDVTLLVATTHSSVIQEDSWR